MSGCGAAGARAALFVALLALVPASAAQIIHPGDKKPAPPPPAPTATHAAAYPGLEPFRRSRFWKKAIDHISRAGLTADAVTSMNQEFTVIRLSNEAAAEAGRSVSGEPLPGTLRLGEKVGEDRRLWLWQVPIVLDQMRPLWDTAEWDEAQLAQAVVVARFFSQQEGPPKLQFVAGRHAENQVQLDRLMAWYRAEVARPESYALMLITDDDGPWLAPEAKATTKEKEVGALDLDAERRLVLRRDEKGGGPWMLQLQKSKKALWTRGLSQVPATSSLRFEGEPQALGDHGSVVHLDFGESVALYLDAQGQPLFYFTSW